MAEPQTFPESFPESIHGRKIVEAITQSIESERTIEFSDHPFGQAIGGDDGNDNKCVLRSTARKHTHQKA